MVEIWIAVHFLTASMLCSRHRKVWTECLFLIIFLGERALEASTVY